MSRFLTGLILCLFLFDGICFAQPDEKKISEYLRTPKFTIDSEASAIVLFERIDDVVTYEENGAKQTLSVHRIIKFLKKEALKSADVKIYMENYDNRVNSIKGTTYNLVGNEVKKTDLQIDEYYKNKVDKNFKSVGFALPDVKEGSIVDYSVSVTYSLHYAFPPWEIQEEYPKLITEFSLSCPDDLSLTFVTHVRDKLVEFTNEEAAIDAPEPFCYYKNKAFVGRTGKYLFWVKKNVHGTRKEPYVVNPARYRENFQLLIQESARYKNVAYTGTWDSYNKSMWDCDLARAVRKPNNFLGDTVSALVNNVTNKTAIAKIIFNYVRNNFRVKYEYKSLDDFDAKALFTKREGNEAYINALLITMLNKAGIDAYLLTTGTTANIPPSTTYPMPNLLQHIVCAVATDSGYTLLDATDRNNAFGILPLHYYNGYARIITRAGEAITLSADRLEDVNTSEVDIKLIDDSTQEVSIIKKFGMISSVNLRKNIEHDRIDENKYFEHYAQAISEDADIVSKELLNLNNQDTNLVMKIVYRTLKDKDVQAYFFNTSFIKTTPENPFVAVNRDFPVEFPYKIKDNYIFNLKVPEGFVASPAPAPVLVTLRAGDMEYDKYVSYDSRSNMLSVNIELGNKKTTYPPADYDLIRAFYKAVIDEENKVIELKRKK